MTAKYRSGAGVVILLLTLGVAGCGDTGTATAPSHVSSGAPPSVAPQGELIQPIVSAITPASGTTRGGSWVTVVGTGFQPGVVVTLGSARVFATLRSSDELLILTPAHAPGPLDVVVANPGGLQDTLPGGYVYAPADTFDFNGDWVAHAGPDYEIDMRFTVRNNVLVSLSCNGSTLDPRPTSAVTNGELSASSGAFAITGTVVAPGQAGGTIDVVDVPECRAARWWAERVSVAVR